MSGNTTQIFKLDGDYKSLFDWTEYLIFGALLLTSMGIGVFYGFFDKKNKTNEEFLMGARSMSVFPVTLSLICSFISAVTLLGNPVEVYFYGLIYLYFAAAFIPMTLAVGYLYVPVFFQLQLTSAYEYFEQRFNKTTRRIVSISAIIHLMIYMPLTVWGPSLALDQVAGVNRYITSAVIFIVCVAYSSIGGLKAVLWTDVLQAIIMFGAMITVISLGIYEIGGIDVLWSRAVETGRTNVAIFDVDLRTRHTFWTGLIAAYFSWIPLFGGTQAQIQRYLSVPTLKDARKCLFFNMLGLFAIVFLCSLTGLLIFARYYDCDPVTAISPSSGSNVVSSADQLLPFFVMDVLGKYPTLPGILLAGLTSGSLSSVSSSLNALPAIIVEDYVKTYKPGLSDVKLGYISKIISAVGGVLSFALIFVIAAVGNILPFASLLHGTFIGPIVGLFSLGMFFPWANTLGSTLAVLPSVGITLFFGIGSIIKNNAGELPNQRLSLRTDGCYIDEPMTRFLNMTQQYTKINVAWKDQTYEPLTKVLSISYLWQPLITIVSTVIFGLLFSAIVNCFKRTQTKVHKKYMTPIILSMWIRILGVDRLRNWIDFDDDEGEDQGDNGNNNVLNSSSPVTLSKGKKLQPDIYDNSYYKRDVLRDSKEF